MAKLDAGGVKSADDLKESNKVEAEGHFMVIVKEVKYNDKNSPAKDIIATEVVGGTVPGQFGKEVAMFLDRQANGDFSVKRHVRFAIAAGLMQPGQVVDVDDDFFQQAVDHYLIVRIEKSKKGGFFVGSMGDDMWPINDPEMAEIIRAMDGHAIDVMKRFFGSQQQTTQQTSQQTTTRPAQQQNVAAPAMAAAGAGVGNGVAAGAGTPNWDEV